MTGHVWYVAYGSNLNAERFRCYIDGGSAAGSRRRNPGARDRTPVSGDRRVDLRHPLLFGGPSRMWAGGTAYLDTAVDGHGVGRAWRISHGQFEDLVAQENQRPAGDVVIDPTVLWTGGTVLDARYGELVPLDPIDDEPAVTFSYITRPTPRPPDPAYVDVIRAGMAELGLSEVQAAGLLDPVLGG